MFGMNHAHSNRGQTRGFPEKKIIEQATVGIEELRCTGALAKPQLQAEDDSWK
jgi:hypothetical protein